MKYASQKSRNDNRHLSFDGKEFTTLGDPYRLTWGHYRGDRVAIFSFNDVAETGRVDVDYFHFTVASK